MMKLREIAHTRSGDKGNMVNIAVIPYDEKNYEFLKQCLTADIVKSFFHEMCYGPVTRYEVDGICALNFVLEDALDGGDCESLNLDRCGRNWSALLLELELERA